MLRLPSGKPTGQAMRMIFQKIAPILLALSCALPALGALAQGLADEDRDWQVSAPQSLRRAPYSAPTPVDIPAAKVIKTADLKAALESAAPPIVIDVAAGEGHETLPGAIWIPGAGRGDSFIDTIQAELTDLLVQLTAGDRSRELVFLCVNSQCWLSFNAARRAVVAGFRAVYWYRGGYGAWKAAGLPLVPIRETTQP